MKTTSFSERFDQQLIELSAFAGATIQQGAQMLGRHDFDSDDKKKGSKLRTAADIGAAGAVGAGAGAVGTYVHGVRKSGGNASGMDAMRVGARDISNKVVGATKAPIKAGGAKLGKFLGKAGRTVAKAAKNLSALDRITEFTREVEQIVNFETIDNATAKKPVNKQPAKSHKWATAVGMGTAAGVGAAAGHYGTKHSAQIAKAGKSGVTMAKAGYKTGKSKMASVGKGVMGEMRKVAGKFKK
jgi:hypothetical protein